MASRKRARWWRWVGWGGVAAIGLVIVAIAGSHMADRPLRSVLVRQMNQRLKGYTAALGAARFHPVGLSLTPYDLSFVQDAHPDPPVFHVRRLDASVQWRALIHGRLVADFAFTDPTVYANLQQLRAEAADPTPLDQHGWQEAFEAIYPLKINEISISNGMVTYVDDGPFKPLEITRLTVRAQNIRNIRSKDRTYPSDLHLDAIVFGTGHIVVDGHADFLAEPIPGLQGDVALERVDLDYFKSVLNHGSVAIQGRLLDASGAFDGRRCGSPT